MNMHVTGVVPRLGLVSSAVLVLAGIGLVASVACAQGPFIPPGQLPPIDAGVQAAIIDSVISVLDSSYVMADIGARMARHLREGWKAGEWRDLTDPALFVQRLNEELHSVYDDSHLGMAILPPRDPQETEDVDPRDTEAFHERERRSNYGFRKIELLPGNIGYLQLDQFADTGRGGETAVAAMNFLANADALIIDLRRNGGGSASMIQLLTGYLLPEQEHLINWYVRAKNETVQSWSQAYVPGRRMPDVPVYILTSRRTFSAAEEFTFDMKNLERATVVGDTTGGGGNTVASHSFAFEGFQVGMRASYGAATDPRSGEGWEGVGVRPHIAVDSELALETAQRQILSDLMAQADPDARFELEWVLQDMQSRLDPTTLTRRELKAYVGSYGPRRIFLEGDALYYQRADRPQHRLTPMGADLFRVGDLEYFRLEFERDEHGRITRVVGLYDNGRRDANERE